MYSISWSGISVKCDVVLNNQAVFIKKKLTITAVVSYIESIIESIDKGEKVDGVFMDLSKAFDSVERLLLLSKTRRKIGIR